MEPNYQRKMRVREQRTSGGRELLVTVFVEAEIKPWALVLRRRSPHHTLDVLIATGGTAHNAIRPAHLFDVLKALLFRRELYGDFPDVYWLGMDSLWHESTLTQISICVK